MKASDLAAQVAGVLAEGGSAVSYITRDQVGKAPLDADVVVLAVPYPAVDEILTAMLAHDRVAVAGVGDVVLTCNSMKSRNASLGFERIGTACIAERHSPHTMPRAASGSWGASSSSARTSHG